MRFPVLALSITDDELMTARGTRNLLALYPNAPQRIDPIAPADVQARRIGHFGLFRSQFAGTLWPRTIDSLRALATLPAATAARVPPTTA